MSETIDATTLSLLDASCFLKQTEPPDNTGIVMQYACSAIPDMPPNIESCEDLLEPCLIALCDGGAPSFSNNREICVKVFIPFGIVILDTCLIAHALSLRDLQ